MRSAKEAAISMASILVFSFLDLLDFCLCFLYMFVDSVLEDNPAPCFCRKRGSEEQGIPSFNAEDGEISETLYERRNIVRQIVLCSNKEEGVGTKEKKCHPRFPRWSDCRCEACFSLVDWAGKKPESLYFVLKETNPGMTRRPCTRRDSSVGATVFQVPHESRQPPAGLARPPACWGSAPKETKYKKVRRVAEWIPSDSTSDRVGFVGFDELRRWHSSDSASGRVQLEK